MSINEDEWAGTAGRVGRLFFDITIINDSSYINDLIYVI